MKKVLLVTLLFMSAFTTNAQDFLGIKPSGNKDYTINQFKAKGFKINTLGEHSVLMEGVSNGKDIEIVIGYTPKTKLVHTFTVYMPKQNTFDGIKSDYAFYVNVIRSKYGEPTTETAEFLHPYEEGDGYELNAIELEKTNIHTIFYPNDLFGILVGISKYKQIEILYQNKKNYDLYNEEILNVTQSIF